MTKEKSKTYTEAEIKEKRKEHIQLLDESIEVLKKEAEYERLLMEIDEYRTKRLMYNIQYTKANNEIKNKEQENKEDKKNG